jgi:Mg/Co/Ni transporter MgtE
LQIDDDVDDITEIEDEDTPLSGGVVEIEDEDTPLASGAKEETSNRPWWLLLAATAAAVTGKTIHDKNKKNAVDKEKK